MACPHPRQESLEGLRILGAVQYADEIKRLLRTAEDKVLIRDAIEALRRLVGADAIDAAIDWLNDSDHLVSQEAMSAVRPYLTTHADRLRDLGYTGTRTIIGNVEAGMVWDGHQTLDDGRVEQFVRFAGDTTFTYDNHATMVGGTLVADGQLQTVDIGALAGDAVAAGTALRARSGIDAPARWPRR